MLSDVNMDDPDDNANAGPWSDQARQTDSAQPFSLESQSQAQDGFGFPSMPPTNHRPFESSTQASASGSSDSITGARSGDASNPMTTPQKPIQLGSSAVRSGAGMGSTPTSGLARRMSGKMSLGNLGSASPHGSSFTAHRDSRPGVPDTPVTTGVTSPPLNGSTSPPLTMNMPMQSPFAGVPANSPWAHLAATSGVPTPSLEGPGGPINSPFGPPSGVNQFVHPGSQSGQGRSISPHLGAPFELLNLGGGAAGTSKSPPTGWPGAFSGSGMTAQTPGLGTSNMADPFSSLPAPASASARPQGGRESGTGLGLDSLAAKLAKRRGSKSGPSGLSQSTSVESVPNEMEGQAEAVKPPAAFGGPLAGPGRVNAGGAPMKLNLPPGIAGRLGGASAPTSTSSTPGTSLSKPSGPATGKSNTTVPQALLPSQLSSMLGRPEGEVLILDLRPPSSYVQSHLPGALSLPVPSTLLKRPAFSVEKLAQMLSPRAANAITDFKAAEEIVIVDQDSPMAAPGSVIVGLASKFGNAMTDAESDAKQGHVYFVKGGMAACSDLEGVALEHGQPESSEDETDPQAQGPNSPGSPTGQPGRMIGRLDRMAFSSASASGVGTRRANAPKSLTLPNSPAAKPNLQSSGDPARVLQNETDGPTSENQRSGTTSPRSGPRPTPGRAQVTEKQKLQPANPFFDNIRQNLELAHGGILERIPLELPDDIKARANELPDFLRDMLARPSPEVAEQLAKEFERVERDEQKRLQGIMEWHSRGTRLAETRTTMVPGNLKRLASTGYIRTTQTQSDMDKHERDDYFPFSITAGVERGSKNRYKNIWPYDFSRVRLKEKCYDDGSDYINANFIQPQGTTKRYIATQGPLDATFRDFWTLVWEQQVHVIVMLTKQFEGGACKCGAYWTAGQYGPFHLEHVSTEGGEDTAEKDVSGFNFHVGGNAGPSSEAPNIKRTFLLSHSKHPEEKPRKIIQLQCVAWPDFDVPEDPRLLLGLVKEVDKAAVDLPEEKDEQSRKAPVLVHCSAGVGRTGSFMVVDSILDGLRREHQRQHRKIRGSYSSARGRKGGVPSDGGVEERRPSSASSLNGDSPLASYQSNSSLHRLASSHLLNLASPNKDTAVFEKSPEPARMASPETMSSERPSFGQSFSFESKGDQAKARTPDAIEGEMAFIPLITGEHQNDGEVNSISEMDRPVQSVLGGMRVQRMSLVQSLRQYAFVYRAIIYGFLDILDEEKEAEAEVAAMHEGRGLGSGTNTDEESHIKRRASPTSLSGPSLHKRPSIKITRGPPMKVEGEETHRTSSGLSNETSLEEDPVRRSMDTD